MKFVQVYNPREDSVDVLQKLLIGREAILAEVLADLRRQAISASRQHWLIRGPRGIGKTHLMAMIYHATLADPELSASYQPIWLSEKAAYEIYSAGWFMEKIAAQLRHELAGSHIADEIQDAMNDLSADGDDPLFFDSALEILKHASTKLGKKLLVIVENLDSLLNGFSARARNVESQRVRSVMQHDREFLFVGTTPTHYLPGIADPKKPLYGQFRERQLRELTEDQTATLFATLADVYGQPEKKELLHACSPGPSRRRIFHRLTGGNPRSVVMSFHVVAGGPHLEGIVSDLRSLLDAQTAYFEARLAGLAPRERVIVGALSASDANLTAQEIARRTRLPERSISTQLGRLVEEGHVAEVEGGGGKGAVYEVSDGLFRLWYQFREGRRLLEPIVRFLSYWHSPAELADTISSLSTEMAKAQSFAEIEAARLTLLHVEEAYRFQTSEYGRAERKRFFAEDVSSAEESRNAPKEPPELKQARALIDDQQYAEAISILQGLISVPSENHANTAKAMVMLSWVFMEVGRIDEANSVCRTAIERFSGVEEAPVLEQIAYAMFNLAVGLRESGQVEAAINSYRALIVRFNEAEELETLSQVARATYNLAFELSKAGRLDEAIDSYRALIERFSHRAELTMIESVARAMVSLANAMLDLGKKLGDDNRIAEAIENYRAVIERFGARQDAELLAQVARAMINLDVALAATGQAEEGIRTLLAVIERFGEMEDVEMVERVVLAMGNLGIAYASTGKRDKAIESYRALIERFRENQEPVLREQVARAQVNLGITYQNDNRIDEAIESYQSALRQVGDSGGEVNLQTMNIARWRLIAILPIDDRNRPVSIADDWVSSIVRHAAHIPLDTVGGTLQFLMRMFDERNLRRWLKALESVGDKRGVADLAKLHRFVLDVLEASQSTRGTKRSDGLAARQGRALRRVPVEVRETVKEMVEDILRERRKRRARDSTKQARSHA